MVDLARERRFGAPDAGPPVRSDEMVEVELEQSSEVGLQRWPLGCGVGLSPRRADEGTRLDDWLVLERLEAAAEMGQESPPGWGLP